MAATGLGLAVVPASVSVAASASAPGVSTLRITGPPVRSRLELAWNCAPSANPAARVLIEHAQALVRPR